MEALLRFDLPLDVSLLEQVVGAVYQGSSPEQINSAQRLLSQLQERISGEEASSALNWFRVDMILESTTVSANTKFYALQVRRAAGAASRNGRSMRRRLRAAPCSWQPLPRARTPCSLWHARALIHGRARPCPHALGVYLCLCECVAVATHVVSCMPACARADPRRRDQVPLEDAAGRAGETASPAPLLSALPQRPVWT
jgi:hypothetical protein